MFHKTSDIPHWLDILNGKYERDVQKTLQTSTTEQKAGGGGMVLSAEEEAELAALMSDED